MNKKKVYIFIILLLSVLLLITGTYSGIHYFFNYSSHEWFRESLNNDDYVVVGKEVGECFLWGPTQVEIQIFDRINKLCIVNFSTIISNQGEKLTSDNYDIEYTEEYIKIDLFDSDRKKIAYRFYFDDFK